MSEDSLPLTPILLSSEAQDIRDQAARHEEAKLLEAIDERADSLNVPGSLRYKK